MSRQILRPAVFLLVGATAAIAAAASPRFAYDRALPLDPRVLGQYRSGAATVRTVAFAVERSFWTTVYIVSPQTGGQHPGIIFQPGRGQTRDYFLSEAIEEANRGVTSISLGDLGNGYPTFTNADLLRLTRRVVALRRALDLLLAQPGVDLARIGFVGHSDGAELGGMLAGVERRIGCYVLMSGGGVWDRSNNLAYNRAVAPFDADNFVGQARPASLLFQAGLQDAIVPRSELINFPRFGSRPKFVKWYSAGHVLDQRARVDRSAWLARCLRSK